MEQHTLKVSFIFADGRGQLQDDDSDGRKRRSRAEAVRSA
jgi:hypothetical protein